jgi:flagellar basal-body rod modification protein FlgD
MIAAASQAAAAAAAERPRLAQDFDTFLTLLTTQLRTQSPTDPLNANEMTAQLVQFASVEQQILANRQLERLVSLQRAAQVTAAAPLLGSLVEVESDLLPLQGGVGRIRLAPAEGDVRVRVTDGGGRVLREELVPAGAARIWIWDGRDSAGRPLPDGAYRVAAAAVTGADAGKPVAFSVLGRVSGLEPGESGVHLALGAVTVPVERLRMVQAAP